MKRSNLMILAAAALSVMLTDPAYAQGAPGARDSLCLHFSGDSRDLFVQLRNGPLLSGAVPLTLCNLQRGLTYEMTVRGYGYEIRRGFLVIDETGKASVKGNRMATFARNIVPGWGSVNVGREGEAGPT